MERGHEHRAPRPPADRDAGCFAALKVAQRIVDYRRLRQDCPLTRWNVGKRNVST
jgi:hypothetical protein